MRDGLSIIWDKKDPRDITKTTKLHHESTIDWGLLLHDEKSPGSKRCCAWKSQQLRLNPTGWNHQEIR